MADDCNNCWGTGKCVHPDDQEKFDKKFEEESEKAASIPIAYRWALKRFTKITCSVCDGTGKKE